MIIAFNEYTCFFYNDKLALLNVSFFKIKIVFSCTQITEILRMTHSRLTESFSDQRGAIFRFGRKTNDDTGTILKVEGVCQAKRTKLVNTPIRNLHKEQSVGSYSL